MLNFFGGIKMRSFMKKKCPRRRNSQSDFYVGTISFTILYLDQIQDWDMQMNILLGVFVCIVLLDVPAP